VAAAAPRAVWAVGRDADLDDVLIERWNGNRWSVEATPDVADGSLNGVQAIPPTDVWAVGTRAPAGVTQTLTMRLCRPDV
jgi:hypothetical protein